MTYMLVEELVGKRLQLLQNFREGLDYFELVGMIKANPSLWKPLFVTENPEPPSADTFMSLVEPPSGLEELQARAYAFFVDFVKGYTKCKGTFDSFFLHIILVETAGFFLVFTATGQTSF